MAGLQTAASSIDFINWLFYLPLTEILKPLLLALLSKQVHSCWRTQFKASIARSAVLPAAYREQHDRFEWCT
jgi:hypothetical protein